MNTRSLFDQHRVALAPGISLTGFPGENLMVTHLRFEAGAEGALHAHPHEQLTVVLSGEVEFTLGEERRALTAGDAVAVPGNVSHGLFARTRSEVLDIFTPVRADLVEKLAS